MGVIVEVIANTDPVVPVNPGSETVVVEVLKGAPGVDNVHVGPTPPSNPQVNDIWVDTSGG